MLKQGKYILKNISKTQIDQHMLHSYKYVKYYIQRWMFIPYYGTFSKILHLRYIDTVFKKKQKELLEFV